MMPSGFLLKHHLHQLEEGKLGLAVCFGRPSAGEYYCFKHFIIVSCGIQVSPLLFIKKHISLIYYPKACILLQERNSLLKRNNFSTVAFKTAYSYCTLIVKTLTGS